MGAGISKGGGRDRDGGLAISLDPEEAFRRAWTPGALLGFTDGPSSSGLYSDAIA